jgi:hypothetical protein
MAGMPEGGEETAEQLLLDDVVLLVPLVGVEGLGGSVSTVRPSGGGTEVCRRCRGWCFDGGKRNWRG